MHAATLCCLLLASMSPDAHAADWEHAHSEAEVSVHTTDADGDARTTTIWIVVLDGDAFVRTSGTVWERNIRRDPRAMLTIAGQTRVVRVERVSDRARIERVQAQFRAKYGATADGLARVVRWLMGGESRIYCVRDLAPR